MASEEPGESVSSPSPLMAGNVITPRSTSVNISSALPDQLPPPEKQKRNIVWIGIFFLLLLVGGGVFWFFRSRDGNQVPVSKSVPVVVPEKPKPSTPVVQEESTPEILPNARYQSENFRVGDIAIGGEAELYVSEDDPSPLQIEDVRGEAFTEKSKQEVRLVLNWRTNKLAKAEVEYSKGAGQTPKVATEDEYGLNHSLTISGLDQASTYVYVIKGEDRFGNTVASDQHAVYTGSKTVSLFDLIGDAVGQVFGWAVKKK